MVEFGCEIGAAARCQLWAPILRSNLGTTPYHLWGCSFVSSYVMWDYSIYHIGLLRGLNGLISTKHLGQCLGHSKCSISPSNDDGDDGDDDGDDGDDDDIQPEEKADVQGGPGDGFRALMACLTSRSNSLTAILPLDTSSEIPFIF